MKTPQHTPGPWRLGEAHSGGATDIKAGSNLIATAICPRDHAQARANARLIAAAPEMRQWIQEVITRQLIVTDVPGTYAASSDEIVAEARALLARIDGSENDHA